MKKRHAAAALAAAALVGTAAGPPAHAASTEQRATSGTHDRADRGPFAGSFHLRPTDSPEMHEAWHLWRSTHDGTYRTRVDRACYCGGHRAVLTTVRDGAITRVATTDRPFHAIDRKGWSMDRLFFLIRHATAKADTVEVTYGRAGVPRRIFIDFHTQLSDDEMYYSASIDPTWHPGARDGWVPD